MATISSYDSSSISVLFSSVNNANKANNKYSSDLLGINYSDYATIKNGSYFKLMKAYYTIGDENSAVSTITNSTSTSKDSTERLSMIEDASDKVKESVDELLTKGSKSLFNKTTTTDESGKVTESYDTDAIYKAVNKFVDKYNDLIETTEKTNTENIATASKRLINLTEANQKMLSSVGITVNEDYTLSIDEKKFKEADMNTVKSMFNSTGGYAYQVSAQSSMIHMYAENEATKANTYTSSGDYTYNYNTGEIYNTSI